ncbi:MAG: preprotein translocase subunit SecY [Clostridiales bacterium]|nr:preprotein translocase subunit SecY [Clostridiales bacterium]
MLQTLKNAFLAPDIRKKMFYTLIIVLIYRVGCFVPIPGLNLVDTFGAGGAGSDYDLMSMLSMITGGSLSNGTLFALGIVPFINSFIIMQLLTLVIPKLERLSKEGEEGRKQINQYTRYLAIGLALVQAVGVMLSWRSNITGVFGSNGATDSSSVNSIFTMICIVIILTGGSAMVMWLGERITEYGIGNGTSLIIFIGIVSSLGNSIWLAIFKTIPNQVANGDLTGIWFLMGFILLVILLFLLIVFVDLSERRIPVQYAKQIKGNKMYGGQSTFIPIKVNSSGVMPIIFASSLIMFPQMIMQFVGKTNSFTTFWYKWMGVGGNLYPLFLFLMIIFFAYFYAQIQFNPDDIAKMIQQNGGFIPGIRPGKSTSDHLRKINNRITLFGALFLAFVALIPTYILKIDGFATLGFDNSFSATGLLIVVSVALEFEKSLESQLLVKTNKGFLK